MKESVVERRSIVNQRSHKLSTKFIHVFLSLTVFSLFAIKSTTAQFFNSYGGGGYGGYSGSGFSFTGFLDFFGAQNLVYLCLFLIFFTFIYTILVRTRIFRDHLGNPSVGSNAVISLCISLMATWGIYRTGFDVIGLFVPFGFSADSLYPILAIFSIVISIFLIWKLKGGFLMILGVILAALVFFTDVIYEKNTALIIAAILFIIGFFLLRRVRNRIWSNYSWQKESRQWRGRTHVMILGFLGIVLGIAMGNNITVIAIGAILTLVGFWLWHRNRPGLYRPLDFSRGYHPIQERRQFLSGGPLILIGLLIVGVGLTMSMNVIMIIGGVIALLGFGLRLFR